MSNTLTSALELLHAETELAPSLEDRNAIDLNSLGVLNSVVAQIATSTIPNDATPTPSNALSVLVSAESVNALSVLLPALSTSIAAAIESELSSESNSLPTIHHPTPPLPLSTTTTTPSTSTSTSTTTSTTPTPTSSTLSTSTTSSSAPHSSIDSALSPSPTTSPPDAMHPVSNAAIAGIVSGITAGAVLVLLGGLFFFRKRRQGRPLFGRKRGSKRSGRTYPEVAWLYDPSPSPTRGNSPAPGHARNLSDVALLDRNRGIEMQENGPQSPHLPPAGPSSPLLPPPGTAFTRDLSARPSRSSSIDAPIPVRYMEEPRSEAAEGLLAHPEHDAAEGDLGYAQHEAPEFLAHPYNEPGEGLLEQPRSPPIRARESFQSTTSERRPLTQQFEEHEAQ